MNWKAVISLDRKMLIYSVGVLLTGIVVFVDLWTGPEISIGACYLLPTTWVAWNAGRAPGIVTGFLTTLAWLAVELSYGRGYGSPLIPVWNMLVQMTLELFWAVVTAGLAQRERELKVENQVRRQAEQKLTAIRETLEERVAERSAAAERRAEDLVKSEASLRHYSGLLRSILSSMSDGVVATDTQGRIRLYNPAAAHLLSIEPGAGGASDWTETGELALAGFIARYSGAEQTLARALNRESIDAVELNARALEHGEESWMTMTAQPLLDEGGFHGVVFVFRDITERKGMDKVVAEVGERERQRIGRDLHDGLGQVLVSAAFGANLLKDKLAQKGSEDAEEATEIADVLQGAITLSRNLARGLSPVHLSEDGLACALEELAASVTRSSKVICRYEAPRPALIHDSTLAAHLYRMAQEAVNNAIRHGLAKKIVIRLEERGGVALLTVVNDGRPFAPPNHRERGMGLQIMNHRARMIGADLVIAPGADGGTVLRCCAPNPRPSSPIPSVEQQKVS